MTPEVTITLTRADLEIMESGSPCYYAPRNAIGFSVGVFIALTPAARRLVREGSAPRAERRARRGRKTKEAKP